MKPFHIQVHMYLCAFASCSIFLILRYCISIPWNMNDSIQWCSIRKNGVMSINRQRYIIFKCTRIRYLHAVGGCDITAIFSDHLLDRIQMLKLWHLCGHFLFSCRHEYFIFSHILQLTMCHIGTIPGQLIHQKLTLFHMHQSAQKWITTDGSAAQT